MNYMNDFPEEMREIALLPPSQQNAALRGFAGRSVHHHRDLSTSPGDANKRPPAAGVSPGVGSYCPVCGAPKDAPCAPWCVAEQRS